MAKPFYKVSKELRWEGAHRLLDHGGACAQIHGHSFRLRVTVGSHSLDSTGLSMEFGAIKKPLQDFIDSWLDHMLLLHKDDPIIDAIVSAMIPTQKKGGHKIYEQLRPVEAGIHRLDFNPTSENMAKYFWDFVNKRLPEGVRLVEIWFSETQSCAVTLTAKGFS